MYKLRTILFIVSLVWLSHNIKAQNCTVNAGISETICTNESMQLQGNSEGLFTTPASWSQVAGPTVNILSPSNLTSGVTGYTGGQSYTFRISATCQDGITVSDDVVITANGVTIANAGSNQQECPGTGVALNANSPGADETGEWGIRESDTRIWGLNYNDPNSTINL